MKLDLSFVPFASNYDENDCFDYWCFGDKDKGEDTTHITIDIDAGFVILDKVVPSKDIPTSGGPLEYQQSWIIYGDRVEYSQNEQVPPPIDWLDRLQARLKPWDGEYRNPNEFSINN